MTEDAERPKSRMSWIRDINVLIGIGGVVATIIVGVVTYWLTTDSVSKEYQERLKAARNDVLTSVTRSIAEGVVPNRNKIQSVLNSVRRQYGIKESDFETPDTVIDNILTRVLANEFLDAKRREELSEKLMTIKEVQVIKPDENVVQPRKTELINQAYLPSLVLGILASMMAAVTLTLIKEKFKGQLKEGLKQGSHRDPSMIILRQSIVMLLAMIAIIISIWLLFTFGGQNDGSLTVRFKPFVYLK